jgi:hypothetical protein
MSEPRECRERRPPPQVPRTEQGHRLGDRVHHVRQADRGRVDVAQQPQAEPDVVAHVGLELGERRVRILQTAEQAHERDASHIDPAAGEQLGTLVEEPLEALGAERAGERVIPGSLDLLDQQVGAQVAQPGDVAGEPLPAERHHVELDHVDVLEQALLPRAQHEVVQGDLEPAGAGLRDRGDEWLVDHLVLQDLQAHPATGQRVEQPSQDRLAGDVDPGEL